MRVDHSSQDPTPPSIKYCEEHQQPLLPLSRANLENPPPPPAPLPTTELNEVLKLEDERQVRECMRAMLVCT